MTFDPVKGLIFWAKTEINLPGANSQSIFIFVYIKLRGQLDLRL